MILVLASFVTALFFLSALFLRRTTTPSKNQPRPLSQMPGPRALPLIGHGLHFMKPLHHRAFYQISSHYGPLIHLRVGSMSCVVISSPDLAKEFLKTNELEFPTHFCNVMTRNLLHEGAFTFSPYGQYWKIMRKLCVSEFLGNRTLNQFLPVRTKEIHFFLKELLNKANGGKEVNFMTEVTKLTTNILSQMMMSIRCSGTEEGAEKAMIVHEVAQIIGEPYLGDLFSFFKYLDLQGIGKRCENIKQRYDAMLEDIMGKREELRRKKKQGEAVDGIKDGSKDFLDLLYDVFEDENAEIKLTRLHIKALILDFFTAGSDTTATGIEWALAELINNPKVMKRAQEEIDSVTGRQRLVTESDGPNLPYIQAIIKETLRLHPSLPVYAKTSVQDSVVHGYKIPTNTILFVNVWAIARDPNYWINPLEFRPERFLNNDPTSHIDVKGQHFELIPFGTGKRGCPGMSLALRELHTVVAAIIQCFELKVRDNNGVVNMDERPGLSVPRAHDLLCVPVTRIDNLDSIIG